MRHKDESQGIFSLTGSEWRPVADEPATGLEGAGYGKGGATTSRRRPREQRRSAPELRERVYSFRDLSGYSLWDRIAIRTADLFFYVLIRAICSTLRWDWHGREHLDSIIGSGHRPIFTFWHTCIFGATWAWRNRGIVVMSSRSRDGEFTGRFIKRLGYGTARGSSTRGAGRALAEMAQCLDEGIEVAFTIDGPRGPAFVAKTGAVTLARHTGQPILPFHVAAPRHITLPSWDRLQIPLPFTRAVTLVGEPIFVPRDASPDEIVDRQRAVQSTLDRLRKEADTWFQSENAIPRQ